jgi:hypothetical protein
MKLTLEESMTAVESEDIRRWLQSEDDVLSHQAAITVEKEGLDLLTAEYVLHKAWLEAAKTRYAMAAPGITALGDYGVCAALCKEALEFLQKSATTTQASQQLEYEVMCRYVWVLTVSGGEQAESEVRSAPLRYHSTRCIPPSALSPASPSSIPAHHHPLSTRYLPSPTCPISPLPHLHPLEFRRAVAYQNSTRDSREQPSPARRSHAEVHGVCARSGDGECCRLCNKS